MLRKHVRTLIFFLFFYPTELVRTIFSQGVVQNFAQ